jgi:hypothetical protein
MKYNGYLQFRSVGWSGQFRANYDPVFPIEIIITVDYYYYYYYYYTIIIIYNVTYSILALRSFTLALGNDLEICDLLGYYTALSGSVLTFRDNLSIQYLRVFLNFLTLEDGTCRLSRNVVTELPLNAV